MAGSTKSLLSRSLTWAFVGLISCALPGLGLAQYGTGQPVGIEEPETEDGPAPVRDLSGVWMRIRPPEGGFYSNATWTEEGPELTPAGQALFGRARNSNAGGFSLAETNDPVLTRC